MIGRVFAIGLLGAVPILGNGCPCCPSRADDTKHKMASLGAETRNATEEEAKAYSLAKHKVGCINGLYVKAVEKGGAADRAGLKQGDVILSVDSNRLYSRDDLLDFLGIAKPDAKVEALVKRAGTYKQETVAVALAATKAENKGNHVTWQHAGAGQFDAALAAARKDRKRAGRPLRCGHLMTDHPLRERSALANPG